MRYILGIAGVFALAAASPLFAQSSHMGRDRGNPHHDVAHGNHGPAVKGGSPHGRSDPRYDWRSYRRAHKAVFARGRWQAPFRYQAFREGTVVRRDMMDRRYFLSDPSRYQLRSAGLGKAWIRHYDDVLLVDIRSGRVSEVLRNFFW